jgi:hypothetical protein
MATSQATWIPWRNRKCPKIHIDVIWGINTHKHPVNPRGRLCYPQPWTPIHQQQGMTNHGKVPSMCQCMRLLNDHLLVTISDSSQERAVRSHANSHVERGNILVDQLSYNHEFCIRANTCPSHSSQTGQKLGKP